MARTLDGQLDDDTLRRVFVAALRRTGAERRSYLDRTCGAAPKLRREVESLLLAIEAEPDALDFLQIVDGSETDCMTGQMVSHFRIGELMGGGGMGVVYKARDTRLDRVVALKFLPAFLASFSDWRENFVQEARAVSSLDHPNIAVVHEIDSTPSGQLFIAMAFYEGETLKKILRRGPLATMEAISFAIQSTAGLAHAHGRGVVHRDIKPANLMVVRGQRVRIVDFGLSGVTRSVAGRSGPTVGTTAYMSPEQACGFATDARTDIWSLGVVLYEMLAGTRPFRGDHPDEVLRQVLKGVPNPIPRSSYGRRRRIWHAIEKALAKDPHDRYRSADEFGQRLIWAATGYPSRFLQRLARPS